MKKHIYIIFVFILTGMTFGQTIRKISPKISNTQMIRQKMEMLGFQVGTIREVQREYQVQITAFTPKTGILTHKGPFTPFTATVRILHPRENTVKSTGKTEFKVSTSTNKGEGTTSIKTDAEKSGGGKPGSTKVTSQLKTGGRPGSSVMGVEPSPFVVLNKQQLQDLKYMINHGIQLRGIKFQ